MKKNDIVLAIAIVLTLVGGIVTMIAFKQLEGFACFITASLGIFTMLCGYSTISEYIAESEKNYKDWDLFDE